MNKVLITAAFICAGAIAAALTVHVVSDNNHHPDKLLSSITSDGRSHIGLDSSTVTSNRISDSDYEKAVRNLESRYPELNPDDPNYRPDLVQRILLKRDSYQSNGMSGAEAVQKAVSVIRQEDALMQFEEAKSASSNLYRTREELQRLESEDRMLLARAAEIVNFPLDSGMTFYDIQNAISNNEFSKARQLIELRRETILSELDLMAQQQAESERLTEKRNRYDEEDRPSRVNSITGEALIPSGPNYIGSRDGRVYVPSGSGHVIDTRTGTSIPTGTFINTH